MEMQRKLLIIGVQPIPKLGEIKSSAELFLKDFGEEIQAEQETSFLPSVP